MALFQKKATEQKSSDTQEGAVSVRPAVKSDVLSIYRPHVTEKTFRMMEKNQYVFVVDPSVSKQEVAKQVEKLYGVTVVKARSIVQIAKLQMFRGKASRKHDGKKVIVTVKEGQKIDLTANK
jgi:large subunit ribosomal protein L23